MNSNIIKIGIIGGSGLEDPNILKDSKDLLVKTKYGDPSSTLKIGKINGIDVVLLSRHGRKHEIYPSAVNHRANICALKEQGCTHIIATTACGSLRDEIKPGDFVFVDQFIDRTSKHNQTFYDEFGKGVCHIPMAEPFCPNLRKILKKTSDELKFDSHENGTVITIEGPRFSTRAESKMYKIWGADVINMSTVPEAVLAREAGLCYSAIAMSTDYDCWKDSRVNIEEVIKTFKTNADRVVKLIVNTVPKISKFENCRCVKDIETAVIGKG